jgi:hypothetical protein
VRGRGGESARTALGIEHVDVVTGPYDVVAQATGPTLLDIRAGVLAPIQDDLHVTRALLCPLGQSASASSLEPFEPEPFDVSEPEPALVGVGFSIA